jgi:ATP-binding cassette subfamily C (CFTR/MRP) protein 1
MLDAGRVTLNQVSYGSVQPSTWGAIRASREPGTADETSTMESSGQAASRPLQPQTPLVTEADLARQTGDTECYKIYLRSWGWRVVTIVLALSVANAAMEVMPRECNQSVCLVLFGGDGCVSFLTVLVEVWMKLWVQDGTAGKDTGYAVGFAGFSLLSAVLSILAFLFVPASRPSELKSFTHTG